MKQLFVCAISLALFLGCVSPDVKYEKAVNDPAAGHLARPSKAQYNLQEMQQAMFIQLDLATIQGREYDEGSKKMEDIKFQKLDVNEWCEVAKSWGAKEINFMLSHSGGFCMWPSSNTEYHIGNTAYKGGNWNLPPPVISMVSRRDFTSGGLTVKDDALKDNTEAYTRGIDVVKTSLLLSLSPG
ncbi:MAG: hypothetical protein COB60_05800 [Flavobacteriaceae bacterium]|nr:MAG: hypothetical protein COB60_05800 [Flavobacteriaceae bacterium]